jgi:hypothetical protein
MAGLKNDSGKPDLTLVSYELMVLLARVREFGNKKYERNNWKKGFKVTRSLAAALRHIFQFLSGETLDPESGLSHLGHAIASIEHAVYDMEHRPENDDRDPTPSTLVNSFMDENKQLMNELKDTRELWGNVKVPIDKNKRFAV